MNHQLLEIHKNEKEIRFLAPNGWQPHPRLDSHIQLSGILHPQSLKQISPAIKSYNRVLKMDRTIATFKQKYSEATFIDICISFFAFCRSFLGKHTSKLILQEFKIKFTERREHMKCQKSVDCLVTETWRVNDLFSFAIDKGPQVKEGKGKFFWSIYTADV